MAPGLISACACAFAVWIRCSRAWKPPVTSPGAMASPMHITVASRLFHSDPPLTSLLLVRLEYEIPAMRCWPERVLGLNVGPACTGADSVLRGVEVEVESGRRRQVVGMGGLGSFLRGVT